MNPYLPIIIVASLFVAITADPPILKLETLHYYDEFGDSTVFIHTGGHATFECHVDSFETVRLLDPESKVISETAPTYEYEFELKVHALLRLDITNTTKFGKYRCRYEGQDSADAIDLNYRLCTDTNRRCWDGTCGSDQCIETAEGGETCRRFSNSWCGDACNKNTTSITLKVDSLEIEDNNAIGLSMDEVKDITITVSKCGRACRNMKAFCSVKDMSGQVVVAREYDNFTLYVTNSKWRKIDIFDHLVFKTAAFNVFKMQCVIANLTHVIGRLTNRVVYFGTKPVITASTVNGTTTLRCDLVPHPPLPFRIDGFYFGRPSQSESNNGTITNPRAGNYSCIVSIEYLRCGRHQKIWAGGFQANLSWINRDGNGAVAKGVLTSFVVLGTLIIAVISQTFM